MGYWLSVEGNRIRWRRAGLLGILAGASGPQDRVTAELNFYDQNGNAVAAPPEAANVNPIYLDTNGWEQMFTQDFHVPAAAVIMEIDLLLIINATALGDIVVWFDDVF